MKKEHTERFTADELRRRRGQEDTGTDWEALDVMADEDIDTTDIPELDARFWQRAEVRMPTGKERITLRVDADVVAWFRSQGKGYQTRMNAVLRSFMQARQSKLQHS